MILLLTNSFTAPHIVHPEPNENTYYDYITITELESLEELSYPPLLVDANVYTLTLNKLETSTITKLLRAIKEMHPSNVLILQLSVGDSIALQNKLSDNDIQYEAMDCNYLPKQMFDAYVFDMGFVIDENTDTLHKRLKGNLSNSLSYLIELSLGKQIDRVISAETRADYSTFVGVLLGIDTTVVKQRRMLRVLRREHPAYLKAILKSQLSSLIKMKENQDVILHHPKEMAKLKVDQKMLRKYTRHLSVLSLPSLKQIKYRLDHTRATEPLLTEFIMWVWTGGYELTEEEY